MVTTSQDPSGKFKLQPLKDKSDDVIEVGLSEAEGEKKAFLVSTKLEKSQSADWIIETYKQGNRVILIDIRPMKSTKNKADELRRVVDRIKLQVEKTGQIMQLDDNWLMILPKDIDLLE
jgi:SepF-like predicted cell division protein (DUF552 family)